jgi:membrane-associated phospholipid phosphatase
VRESGRYTFIDYATQGYVALVGLLVLVAHGQSVPDWSLLVAVHVAALPAIHGLIQEQARRPGNGFLDLIRHFYPLILFTPLYCETGALNHMFIPGFLDPSFIRLEQHIFGLQPSLALMDWLPYPFVSEVLYTCYFSYYLMIAGVGLALFLRSREQFFHYASILTFVTFTCFLVYIFIPVIGPRIFFRSFTETPLPADVRPLVAPVFPAAVQAGPAYHVMAWIYRHFETPGAAFPSSHVAVAITTVCFSFLYLRRIRWLHFGVACLLCVSTVYCRYHYAVDVVAGALTAAILIPLGNWLYFKFRRPPASP